MKADKMIDSDSTYGSSGSAATMLLSNAFVNPDAVSLISLVSILILLLLSEGNILLGIIS